MDPPPKDHFPDDKYSSQYTAAHYYTIMRIIETLQYQFGGQWPGDQKFNYRLSAAEQSQYEFILRNTLSKYANSRLICMSDDAAAHSPPTFRPSRPPADEKDPNVPNMGPCHFFETFSMNIVRVPFLTFP